MRSFAYAQEDATEMSIAGKAERAERSGLPSTLLLFVPRGTKKVEKLALL